MPGSFIPICGCSGMGLFMKKAFRMISAAMVMLILALQISFSALAASQTATIDVGDVISATGGQTISLPIGIASAAGSIRFIGINITVTYDSSKLSYVESPVVTGVPALSSTEAYHNPAKATVSMAWTNSSAVTAASGTTLYTLTFRVLSSVTGGDTEIAVKIDDCYNFESSFEKVNITNTDSKAVKKINFGSVNDPMVKKAKDAINAIGTVVYTSQCLTKINEAAYRYSLLSNTQKSFVDNYDKLLQAIQDYEKLKYEDSKNPIDQMVNEYLGKHGPVLVRTVESITLSDETAVNAAYNDYQSLSVSAKNELHSEYIKLKNMKTRISELKKAEEDRLAAEKAEREAREEAKEFADGFKSSYTVLLKTQDSELLPAHYSGVSQALANLNILSGLNIYVGDLLTAERVLLEHMMEIVERLIEEQGDGPTAAEMTADKFQNTNSWLLSQTVASISADDKLDILIALEVYNILDPDAQNLLSKEYELLNKLLARANQLESQKGGDSQSTATTHDKDDTNGGYDPGLVEDTDPDDTEDTGRTDETDALPETTQTGGTTVVPGSNGDGDNKSSGSLNGKSSMSVPIALLVFVVSFILFEALQAFYHLYYKKKVAPGTI